MRFKQANQQTLLAMLLHGPMSVEDLLFEYYKDDIKEMIERGIATGHTKKYNDELARRRVSIMNAISMSRMSEEEFVPINAKYIRAQNRLIKVYWATYKCPTCFHKKEAHFINAVSENVGTQFLKNWFCAECDDYCGAKVNDLEESHP